MKTVSAAALRALLLAPGEFALLDVREQGVHYRGHPFFACSLPLSKLELMAGELVPRTGVPLVLLDGGNAAWAAAGLALESGSENLTTELDDVWYKPYDHTRDYERHARAYLSWEVALAEQIKREPAVRFRTYDQA